MRKICLVMPFFMIGVVLAAGDFQYSYSPVTDRDPLYPLINEKGEITIRENKELGDIFLQGILYSQGQDSIVIINKEIFHEGDNFEGYKIKKIQSNGIFLEKEQEEYFLKWEE